MIEISNFVMEVVVLHVIKVCDFCSEIALRYETFANLINSLAIEISLKIVVHNEVIKILICIIKFQI